MDATSPAVYMDGLPLIWDETGGRGLEVGATGIWDWIGGEERWERGRGLGSLREVTGIGSLCRSDAQGVDRGANAKIPQRNTYVHLFSEKVSTQTSTLTQTEGVSQRS